MVDGLGKFSYGILLLAAGMSNRLGVPKQLLGYKGGSLLSNALQVAQAVEPAAIVVVLGADAAAVKKELRHHQVEAVLNERFREGMASSIRCGVQHVIDHHKGVEGLIIMVCDQPYVHPAHLVALLDKQRATGARIVASFYAGKKGVPALFCKAVFPELLQLNGDTGAASMIKKHHKQSASVAFPLGEVDIDTYEDYKALVNTAFNARLKAK